MALTLSNLSPTAGSKRKKKRVGRGNASGHGTTATRGSKGQRARSGSRKGLKMKGLKARLQKLPKNRGFHSHYPKAEVVNLATLEKCFVNGALVNPRLLKNLGLVDKINNGVKVLGKAGLTKKLTVKGCETSITAKEQIEKAGGKVL